MSDDRPAMKNGNGRHRLRATMWAVLATVAGVATVAFGDRAMAAVSFGYSLSWRVPALERDVEILKEPTNEAKELKRQLQAARQELGNIKALMEELVDEMKADRQARERDRRRR